MDPGDPLIQRLQDVRETLSGNGDRLPEFECYLLYFPGIFKTLLGGLIEKLLDPQEDEVGRDRGQILIEIGR